MPITVQPELIEVSDFAGGWSPDGEDATTDQSVLLDALNVLLDPQTRALVARPGFSRLLARLVATSHWILKLFHYKSHETDTKYIIAVITDGTANANNVQLWAINLTTTTAARMDTAGRIWAKPTSHHWGITIDKTFYGGSQGNEMYSWNGTTWNATAATGSWNTLVDAVDAGVNTNTQYGRDFAFTGKEKVFYGGVVFKPSRQIRYDTWESGQRYASGDRVSIQRAWGQTGTPKYWKSFKCIRGHEADATNRPQDGTGSPKEYWQRVKLTLPTDESGDTSDAWFYVPLAAQTSIGVWHADRLFLRFDGQGDKSRAQYSAPIKAEKGVDIANTVWDPKDFAPGTDKTGTGGGWLPFNDGKKGGVIEAMHSYGQYLLVFKRKAVWALSGTDDATWTVRAVAGGMGTMGPKTVVEYDGLVYFLSDNGLHVTDGTAARPVDGNDKVAMYIRDRLDYSMKLGDDRDPELHKFDGFIFISLPAAGHAEPHVTLAYHPETKSFWKTNIPMLAGVTYNDAGVTKFAFSSPPTYGDGKSYVMLYRTQDTDDNAVLSQTNVPIAWNVRFSWWPFGTLREQRRIRKVWALVRGAAQTVTLKARRDYSDTVVKTTNRVLATSVYPQYIEGEWFADSHAVNFEVSGTAAPAAVFGASVKTESRRARYHVNI